jgi:hypothetical protein
MIIEFSTFQPAVFEIISFNIYFPLLCHSFGVIAMMMGMEWASEFLPLG